MTTEIEKTNPQLPADVSRGAMIAAIADNDFARLTAEDRLRWVGAICQTVGLNPLTRPIEWVNLGGRLIPYVTKGAAEQLRKLHGVSVEVVNRTHEDGCIVVHVRAKDRDGRADEDWGVVPAAANAGGEFLANAHKRAITQAKRRVTLSICGLGLLDESEIEGAKAPKTITEGPTAADGARMLNDALAGPAAPAAQEATPQEERAYINSLQPGERERSQSSPVVEVETVQPPKGLIPAGEFLKREAIEHGKDVAVIPGIPRYPAPAKTVATPTETAVGSAPQAPPTVADGVAVLPPETVSRLEAAFAIDAPSLMEFVWSRPEAQMKRGDGLERMAPAYAEKILRNPKGFVSFALSAVKSMKPQPK